MTTATPTTQTISDRVQLPFLFDVEKMKQEVHNLSLQNYIYYSVMPLRAPAHLVDRSLPFPTATTGFADGSWTDWLDTPDLKRSPYLTEVVDTFRKHTKVTLVRLLRLGAGETVKEHTDPTLGLHIEESVIRLTIPIITTDKVVFWLNGTPVPMQAGECWYLRLTDPHKILNGGTTERINLTIDMIPNDWVRAQIENA